MRRFVLRIWAIVFGVCGAFGCALPTWAEKPQTTNQSELITALVQRTTFHIVKVAPGGSFVAYLSTRANPNTDTYHCSISVVELRTTARRRIELAKYVLDQDAFDLDGGFFRVLPKAGQFEWSPDGGELLFTSKKGNSTELRLWRSGQIESQLLLDGHRELYLANAANHATVSVEAHDGATKFGRDLPDKALVIRDAYRFFGPLSNPKAQPPTLVQHWVFKWDGNNLDKIDRPKPVYLGFPPDAVWQSHAQTAARQIFSTRSVTSPDHREAVELIYGARRGDAMEKAEYYETFRLVGAPSHKILAEVTTDKDLNWLSGLGWDDNSKAFFFVERHRLFTAVRALTSDGRVKEIYREAAELAPVNRSEGSFDLTADGFNGRTAVAVLQRSTPLVPAELVELDLHFRTTRPVAEPNAVFQKFYRSIRTFLFKNPFYFGRLYIPSSPNGPVKPLVAITYRSPMGFPLSVPGDNIPIPALLNCGFAVLALDVGMALDTNEMGDFRWELHRVEEPTGAIEDAVRHLAAEGLIDSRRVGLAGTSYGAEIAMYAYWKSPAFSAITATTGSWGPSTLISGGPGWADFMLRRGFKIPAPDSYAAWTRLSAALNARPNLPPLLWQAPDHERYMSVESWFALRRAQAPVEWLEYPDEGHLFRSPADKWWVYSRNLDWFRFWLQGHEDPDPAKREQYARWEKLCDAQIAGKLGYSTFCVPTHRATH